MRSDTVVEMFVIALFAVVALGVMFILGEARTAEVERRVIWSCINHGHVVIDEQLYVCDAQPKGAQAIGEKVSTT